MPDPRNTLLSKLFSQSHLALRRYVRRLVGSTETAEEIVQEAFLRTYQNIERVATPRAFLFSAARNLASDARRHARIAKTESLGDFEALTVVSQGASPEGAALADEESRLLKEAIDHLTPQCRIAFALRVFHGYSYKDIAARMEISVKTVENHIATGLRETHRYIRHHEKTLGTRRG